MIIREQQEIFDRLSNAKGSNRVLAIMIECCIDELAKRGEFESLRRLGHKTIQHIRNGRKPAKVAEQSANPANRANTAKPAKKNPAAKPQDLRKKALSELKDLLDTNNPENRKSSGSPASVNPNKELLEKHQQNFAAVTKIRTAILRKKYKEARRLAALLDPEIRKSLPKSFHAEMKRKP